MAGVFDIEVRIAGTDIRRDLNRLWCVGEGRRSRQERSIVTSCVREKSSESVFDILEDAHLCNENGFSDGVTTHKTSGMGTKVSSVLTFKIRVSSAT